MEKMQYETKLSSNPTCAEIFQKISARQIIALMFHDQLADFFDFLGLMGFKRIHEYQSLKEAAEHRCIKRYYINHHNQLLEDMYIENPDVIPDSWYKYTRFDVTMQVRKNAVETAFERYRSWEVETKQFYCDCAQKLMGMGHIADFNKINSLISDVDMELKALDRLIIDLKACGYNEVYIATMQSELHEKYRQMTKDIGIDIC